MGVKREKTSQPTPGQCDFDAIVERLEVASGRRLRSPLRERLTAAYAQNPAGLDRAAERAIQDATTNAIGLLGWRIVHGKEHLLGPAAKPPVRGVGSCFMCGRLQPDALRYAGQWWCSDHEAEAA